MLDICEKKESRKDEEEGNADVLQVEINSVLNTDTVRHMLKIEKQFEINVNLIVGVDRLEQQRYVCLN